jgi:hypothetical protein
MIYFDSETIGLHGMMVLLQYAKDDGPIILHEPWKVPIGETLRLIEWMAEDEVCAFNLKFDAFHVNKLYNIFRLLPGDWIPEEHIEEIAAIEADARDGLCWKPKACLDLMLFARKGPLQVLMGRKPIRIKKVPECLAYPLAKELDKRLSFDPIFFAKRKKYQEGQWQVDDRKDDPDFKDVVLKFKTSTALKDIAKHVLKLEDLSYFQDIAVSRHLNPAEVGWAPFAKVLEEYQDKKTKGRKPWPKLIKYHIHHWHTHKEAREYASKDVELLRLLRSHFGNPPAGDDDSELACMVGAVRWKGFAIDVEAMKELRENLLYKAKSAPLAPRAVWDYLKPVLGEAERLSMGGSTRKQLLEDLTKLEIICPDCQASGFKEIDNGSTLIKVKCDCVGGKVRHPAGIRAQEVLDARIANYQVHNLYDKLILAERLHADLKVIGTLSSRMAGDSNLNVQAINKEKSVRRCFTFADQGKVLCGGDFKSFEVVIAIAVYDDPDLKREVETLRDCHKCESSGQSYYCFQCEGKGKVKDKNTGKKYTCPKCDGNKILTELNLCYLCKGKLKVETKIHALMGTLFYPHLTYEQIVDSDGSEQDYYTKSKSGFFAWLYAGTEYTLKKRLGVTEANAAKAIESITKRFRTVGKKRANVVNMFRAMTQPVPYGPIHWKEPADFIEEPVLGHRRYATLENQICKTLYEMAQKPPVAWRKFQSSVQRRSSGPAQTVSGAVQSALFGAAFQIQSRTERAMLNHEIQSAGAKITKRLQRNVWDVQPTGVNPFVVAPLNLHDELNTVCDPNYVDKVSQVVHDTVEFFKDKVPMLAIEWKTNMGSWAEK